MNEEIQTVKYCCDDFEESVKKNCIQKDKEGKFKIIWKDSAFMAYDWGFLKLIHCPHCGRKIQ